MTLLSLRSRTRSISRITSGAVRSISAMRVATSICWPSGRVPSTWAAVSAGRYARISATVWGCSLAITFRIWVASVPRRNSNGLTWMAPDRRAMTSSAWLDPSAFSRIALA